MKITKPKKLATTSNSSLNDEEIKSQKVKIKDLILLHALMLIYSFSGVFSKLASKQSPLSFKFIFFYGMVLLILFVYAIFWQQVLKRMPLNVAFANKGVLTVWGLIWGALLFGEQIRVNMIIGCLLVLGGIYLVVSDHE